LSVSYGIIDTKLDGAANAVDEEITGMSIGYSMGGMTLNAHHNEGENMGGNALKEVEHTEISLSFAF
jgi:hypothetical protein